MLERREDLLGATFDCECGREHRVETREIIMGQDVLKNLPGLVARHLGEGRIYVVVDDRTREAAGQRVFDILKKAGVTVEIYVVSGYPKGDVETVAVVADAVQSAAGVITVGSGTVNDLGKAAAHQLGLPYFCVATAASMNGYTSSIAALVNSGLKTTVPTTPSLAVLCDLDVLAGAPLELTYAGLGDVVSKPVCNADWMLSHLLLGSHYCPRPFGLIKELEDVYLSRAGQLKDGDIETFAALSEALLYSGVSMCIAGSSAPASGAEHLISHTIDMRALLKGHEHDLHGAQVGVGTSFMVRLYHRFLKLSADSFRNQEPVDLDQLKKHLTDYWERNAAPVIEQTLQQFDEEGRPQVLPETIASRWDEIKERVTPFVAGAERIEQALRVAGAKYHPDQLGMTMGDFKTIVMECSYIRNRFTLLHVLRDAELLSDMTDQVLAEWTR
ncbi:MAG: sn-glycerol-1-phosphate dehydrogenase [Planctomycetota bacterium]|nr:sn-glycerol-1-phosphate dehydrogenase [Planctomycetota bacterium]